MASDSIEIKGAVLVTLTGLCITGDLGIDKDIDIVSAMFNAVSQFVEDTFDRPADQIKMGNLFVTKRQGENVLIWMTSTGTSEDLVKGVGNVLGKIEKKYGKFLYDWEGAPNQDLNNDLQKYIRDLEASVEVREDEEIEVHELGFDILKREDVGNYVGQIEDAYNIYALTGDLETAYRLATEAQKAIEAQDPKNEASSLFKALAAKVFVQMKKDSPESKNVLEEAQEDAIAKQNPVAMAELSEAWSHYYRFANENEKARQYCLKAKDHMNEVGLSGSRDLNRLINFELSEIFTYMYEDRYEDAIEGWKEVANLIEQTAMMGGMSDVDGVMLAKHRISVYNNIGFVSTMRDRLNPENYREAIPYLEKSLQAVEETNARWYIPIVKGNLGMAHAFIGDFETGGKYIAEANRVAKDLKSQDRIAVVDRDLGIFHFRRGMVNKDKRDLYKAMYRLYLALDKQTSDGERDYIKFFQKECEKVLKSLI